MQAGEHQQAGLACGSTGTVRKIALPRNASVPSLPIIRWVRMSIGPVWSRNELSP